MTARSTVIEKSLSCLDWGFASLFPVFGILAAGVALVKFRFVVVETNDRWNPARAHCYWGTALALLSLLAHALIGVFIFLRALRMFADA